MQPMSHLMILISGKQGAGKSTLVDRLVPMLQKNSPIRAVKINFADPLYEMHDFCRGTLKDAGVKIPFAESKDGNLLQLLGTEWGRTHVDKNVWVNVLKGRVARKLEMTKNDGLAYMFVVSDCRFENEFDSFPGAHTIRLECDKEIRKQRVSMWRENDSHPSEVGLDHRIKDFKCVYDSGKLSAEELVEKAYLSIVEAGYSIRRN